MKKPIYTLFFALIAFTLSAAVLNVKHTDGTITQYDATKVERLFFTEDPDLPEVIGEGYSQMVLVKAGTFTMGEPDESVEYTDNCRPVHSVALTQDYYIGKYEVTQSIWAEVMGSNPSYFTTDGANKPVERVSWYDCIEFCNALSEDEGLTPVYTIDKENKDSNNLTDDDDDVKWKVTINASANGYRLPTEAQWEYASKGGHKASSPYKVYSGSDDIDDVAWYYGNNSPSGTKVVGTKSANELGIHDMSGNVYEWCFDWCASYSADAQADPVGAVQGDARVIRGGRYTNNAYSCRSANRNNNNANYRHSGSGLRLVRFP